MEEYPLTRKSWDTETGDLIGEIVASQADESILTDGKVGLGKLKPVIFDPSFHRYRVVGEAVGNAFKDGLKLQEIMPYRDNSFAWASPCLLKSLMGRPFVSLESSLLFRNQRDRYDTKA